MCADTGVATRVTVAVERVHLHVVMDVQGRWSTRNGALPESEAGRPASRVFTTSRAASSVAPCTAQLRPGAGKLGLAGWSAACGGPNASRGAVLSLH
jgi:hypothetical protein